MVNNGKKGCIAYRSSNAICAFKRAYNSKDDKMNFPYIFSCSLFIRLLEINASIISIIDYIDRYRIYILLKTNKQCIEENKLLLLEIKKFADLLAKNRSLFNDPKEFYAFIKSKIFPEYNIIAYKNYLESVGLFQTLSNSRLLYYTGDTGDLIYDAINQEMASPNESLFQACQKIQEQNK